MKNDLRMLTTFLRGGFKGLAPGNKRWDAES
jgi:hypothetical protein